MSSQVAGEEEERRPERRAELEQPGGGHRQPELEQSERHGRPAGLVGEQRGGRRRTSSASPIRSIRPTSSSGHHLCRIGESTAATSDGRRARPPASSRSGPSACRTRHHPAAETACGDLHPDERVGRRDRPTGRARRRARACASRRSGPARSSRRRARSSGPRSRARARRRAAPAADRCRKPAWKPVAQITCSAPSTVGATRKRPSRSAASIGASQARPGGYDGSPKPRRSSARRAARSGVEAGEAALA